MSDLNSFLITTGRTLSQMALYAPEHPLVKGAVENSHRLLSSLLVGEPEVVLSVNEGKLIVNGRPPENVPPAALRPFIQLLQGFELHSLTFLPGISPQEMIPFFRLASRGDAKKSGINISDYLAEQKMEHIKVNLARYAKIAEHETVGAAGKEPEAGKGESQFFESIKDLSLYDMLMKLIEKAAVDPTDREKIFKRALDLVKQEIDEAVEKVVSDFNREKMRLTNERERTEKVIGTAAEGVVVVDESGKVLMMNPAAEDIYGVKLGECLGRPLWEGVREEQMVALAKDLTVPTDRPLVKEVQIHGAPEAQKTLRASSATVQDPEGRIVGMVSVLSDVTKQKELTRLQNEFMANVTHDLRAPIHALKLAVSAILEGAAGSVSTEQNKMLSLASRNVDRLSRLIDDLLDFSKIESGAMEVRAQVIDILPILGEAVASMESWSKNRGINLALEESKDLMLVFADADRILQVINNLVSNAIKFTSRGGRVILRAKNWADDAGRAVRIEVEDNGAGISPADQKRIFDRFVQLKHEEKLDIRGTGLGLSICRALVELHKGKLSLQSPAPASSRGTLFFFTLPAVERSAAKAMPRPVAAPAAPTPEKPRFWKRLFSRFKILILVSLLVPALAEARPFWGTVRRVLEPGLIQLQDGTVVRYLGIQSPEKGNPVYAEAMSINRTLVEKKEVRFRYGLQERGADGIWLAYVFADGVFVNEELVRSGLAVVSRLANEEEYLADLVSAEKEAFRKKRGLWRATELDPYALRMEKATGLPRRAFEEKKPESEE